MCGEAFENDLLPFDLCEERRERLSDPAHA